MITSSKERLAEEYGRMSKDDIRNVHIKGNYNGNIDMLDMVVLDKYLSAGDDCYAIMGVRAWAF